MSGGYSIDELLALQRDTFGYFLAEANPANGLVRDTTRPGSHCSIAAVGLGLAAYTIGAERGYVRRPDAVKRTLATLRFFRNAPHGPEPDATGHRGFYYHFLHMDSGKRAWLSELSTIDTTFLVAGMLACAAYFDLDTPDEREIRELADELYRRVDWDWARDGGAAVTHGWKPETGFLRFHWTGYNEALLLYALGLGSPTHPLPGSSYDTWLSTYQWKKLYGHEFVYGGPLFVHQLSHVWIDFREIRDAYMRDRGIDYFENSRRATYIQRSYAIRNPRGFRGYAENIWGVTASDGPGPATRYIDGRERSFLDYRARAIPWGPDDGTIAPWAAIASLPFAPEIVLPAIRAFHEHYPDMESVYGFKCSFNPTFDASGNGAPWISKGYYGLDQGPIVMMIENHLTGWFWELMRSCKPIATGLRRAGFTGGWLDRDQVHR
ncbi:MAG: glucoamylase family protein [Anaerosomatales bacterium]|nr:glucoamylase family protein [Anaerosomatales bacterium]MDT8434589.1 glucoamylase family protein [Anaerosomatales bacterium]